MRPDDLFSTWPPAEDVPAFRGKGAQGRRCAALVLTAMALLIAMAVAVGHLLGDTTGVDSAVSDWFLARRSSGWNTVSRVLSQAADTLIVVGIGVIATVSGLLRKVRNGLIILIVGMVGEVLMFLAMTALVSRERPEIPRLDSAPPTSSFPSGHTFASVTLWGCLAIMARRSKWNGAYQRVLLAIAIVLPFSVAISRLYRGMHHLTDVLASIVLGCVWLIVIVRVFPLQTASIREPSPEGVIPPDRQRR
ncbi:MAG: phosphatase PAP2 family protein [Ilumatobacteraceae bacterium]